jgi:hypothetical protein
MNTFLQQQIFKQQPKTLLEILFSVWSEPKLCKGIKQTEASNSQKQMDMAQSQQLEQMGWVRDSRQPVTDMSTEAEDIAGIRYQAMTGEDIACATVNC